MQPITAIRILSMAELMKSILSILTHFKGGLIGLFRQTLKIRKGIILIARINMILLYSRSSVGVFEAKARGGEEKKQHVMQC